jgi:gas vesicle protein
MKELLKGALIGGIVSAVVTASVAAIVPLGGEPERSIVQALQSHPVKTKAANPRCAPRPVKMPCLQSDSGS